MSTISTTSQLSNYVSCLGNNDAVIVGTNYDLDVSFNTANTAVSLLSAQIVISKVFPMTAVATGNGFTISGWFLPYGKTQKSNALLIEMDSSVNPTAVYLTGGNSFSLNAVYNGVVITTNSDISAGMVLPQTWNYFCYTVECSGNTVGTAQAIQSLYLNGSSVPVVNTTALYVSTPFTVTYMGKGIVYTNQFQGKLAEMRSFQRVLNPMENRILSACNNVGSAGALTIMPSVVVSNMSSVGIAIPLTVINTIAFSSASMFSYVTISRTPAFVSGPTTLTVMVSMMQRVNGRLLWNDVSVNASTSYNYTITPFVNGIYSNSITTSIVSDVVYDIIAHNSYLYPAAGSNYYTYTGSYNETTYGLYNHVISITGNGTFTPKTNFTANVLIIGGGGAGGYKGDYGGGGGGAGGIGHGSLSFQTGVNYNIVIGQGGSASDICGQNTNITGGIISEYAYGGSCGAGGHDILNGGCGGGGGNQAPTGSASLGLGGSGSIIYYGGNGGGQNNRPGGGGGGGGGNGGNGISGGVYSGGGIGGAGGIGYICSMNNVTYAGGGGGSGHSGYGGQTVAGSGGIGGTGGGGNGSVSGSGFNGTFYGAGGGSGLPGGTGYQGIVIIAF